MHRGTQACYMGTLLFLSLVVCPNVTKEQTVSELGRSHGVARWNMGQLAGSVFSESGSRATHGSLRTTAFRPPCSAECQTAVPEETRALVATAGVSEQEGRKQGLTPHTQHTNTNVSIKYKLTHSSVSQTNMSTPVRGCKHGWVLERGGWKVLPWALVWK